MAASPLPQLRRICLALPQAVEVEAWGSPTFRCGKIFAMYANASDHHGGGRHGVWLKAAPGNQELMVRDRPTRFFVPPYVGPSGWIGVWLDKDPSWSEVALLVEDAWRLIAPKKLVKAFDEGAPPPASGKPAAKQGPAKGKKPAARKTTSAPKKRAPKKAPAKKK